MLSDGRTLTYEYDAEERITKVTDSVDGVTEYTYDAMGQLLTETVNGEVVNEMVYDNYGNILQKNGIRYTYSEGWNDRLAYYDGEQITYDAQGNPLNYLGHTLTWEKGRQLKSLDNTTYAYDANGIRTAKTVNGVQHTYTLDGANILRETWGENILIPLYDNEEQVCGIAYNGTAWFFLKNLQGDVIAITDANGDTVARYTYDAWGKCEISVKSTNASIAEINPYRYRGYYFDTETGLYYLQSRYYDPNTGRFINGDSVEYLGVSGTNMGYNLFAYCENNPVNDMDISGCMSLKTILSKIKDIISKLINRMWNYILSLFKLNKAKRTLSVGTIVISTTIDAIIAGVTNSLIYKGLKSGMKLLLKNKKVRNSFVSGILDFFLNNFWGKKLLWLIYKIALSIVGKAGALGTVASNVFKGYLSNIIRFKSKLLQRASSLISALSSIGGVIALFLDFSDRSWDDFITIKY